MSHRHLVFHQAFHTVIEGDPLRKVAHLGWNDLLGCGVPWAVPWPLALRPALVQRLSDYLRAGIVAKTRIPKPARTGCGTGVHRTWNSGCRSNRPAARTVKGACCTVCSRGSHCSTHSCNEKKQLSPAHSRSLGDVQKHPRPGGPLEPRPVPTEAPAVAANVIPLILRKLVSLSLSSLRVCLSDFEAQSEFVASLNTELDLREQDQQIPRAQRQRRSGSPGAASMINEVMPSSLLQRSANTAPLGV